MLIGMLRAILAKYTELCFDSFRRFLGRIPIPFVFLASPGGREGDGKRCCCAGQWMGGFMTAMGQ